MPWYYISLNYATFAIESKDGVIVRTAPIAKWAKGKKEYYVIDYYRKKGANIEKEA